MIAVPAAAFTASVIFDVLSLVADDAEQAHGYQRRAADLLRLGCANALASVALDGTDFLRAPANETTAAATRKFIVDGAVAAIYLLDLAARQGRAGEVGRPAERVDALPIGLSLAGLALLGFAYRSR